MAVSSLVLGCINTLTLCLSLPILLVGYLIKLSANSPCDPIMYKPLISLGTCLLVVSFFGMLGACCRLSLFLWLYVIMLFILIVSLLASLTVGAVVIKEGGVGRDVLGGLKEFELQGFSGWLKKNVVGPSHWEDVKQCMIHHDACGKMDTFRSIMDFVTMKRSKLTSIEMGCCKPPAECGYEYESGTTWKVPEKGLTSKSKDPECIVWNNDLDKLCYNCQSCKAGYLDFFVKAWTKITLLNALLLLLLFFIFIVACCALRD